MTACCRVRRMNQCLLEIQNSRKKFQLTHLIEFLIFWESFWIVWASCNKRSRELFAQWFLDVDFINFFYGTTKRFFDIFLILFDFVGYCFRLFGARRHLKKSWTLTSQLNAENVQFGNIYSFLIDKSQFNYGSGFDEFSMDAVC